MKLSLLTFGLLFAIIEANPFLDIYFHIHPFDDVCSGSQKCNITYALSVLVSQNQFDLQSLKLQEGIMTSNGVSFEDNTVFRLNKDMFHELDKIYLGIQLFDVPESMQDYIIQDVTNVVNKGQSKRVELVTDSMRTKVHVYRRHEALSTHELEDKNHQVELDSENDEYSSHPTIENGCTCQNSMCSCCKHLKIRKVRLDDVVCVNTTYVPNKQGFHTSLNVIGQNPQFSKEILSGNTRPICFELMRKEYATMCLRLYNFERHDQEVSFCSEIEARLYHVRVSRKKIGCLRISV